VASSAGFAEKLHDFIKRNYSTIYPEDEKICHLTLFKFEGDDEIAQISAFLCCIVGPGPTGRRGKAISPGCHPSPQTVWS